MPQLYFQYRCPTVSDRPSLALEPWTGADFALAAHLPSKAKKEGTVGGAFLGGYMVGVWDFCIENNLLVEENVIELGCGILIH